jgi:hypothetical protein
MLCSICDSIDLGSLLSNSTTPSSEAEPCQTSKDLQHIKHIEGQVKHHDDIFRIRGSANDGCELCAIIIRAFESRKIKDEDVARGMPIVLSSKNDGVRVSIESPGGLIEVCGLDIYIHPGR